MLALLRHGFTSLRRTPLLALTITVTLALFLLCGCAFLPGTTTVQTTAGRLECAQAGTGNDPRL
jgi:hypothetical protein